MPQTSNGAEPAARTAPAPFGTGSQWQNRPPGVPVFVPPPSVPLAYFVAAGIGLMATGIGLVWARGAAVIDPTDDRVVAVAHAGMLATLSMAVLGALHQFTPVVTQRRLTSVIAARATFVLWLAGSWLLPIGFATGTERVVEAGGACAAAAVVIVVWNLARPLAARQPGVPVPGLRLALAGLATTAGFGVVYVADRTRDWFILAGNIVLAHAIVGIFAWLALTYVSVAEKLWPMFLLSHPADARRAPRIAVLCIPVGVLLASPGLVASVRWLWLSGGALLVAGLGAHLWSMASHLRHRRRRGDLYLVTLLVATASLVAGAGLAGAAAVTLPHRHHLGVALAAAAVAAVGGWLLIVLVGHAHKVVPFIAWSAVRARGVTTGPGGRPLLFGDLYVRGGAWAALVLVALGVAATCVGLAASLTAVLLVGGCALAAGGAVALVNLVAGPLRIGRMAAGRAPSVQPPG